MDLEVQEDKMEKFFSVIMPNYNNGEWITKSLNSIFQQTFTDYEVIVIDDCSTDNSVEQIKNFNVKLIECKEKAYNGGARNIGLKNATGKYVLFLDSDDWFSNKQVFQTIYNKIIQNNYPDCVSLSYDCLIGNNKSLQVMNRNSQKELVESVYVACWTKCIKRELIPLFPENTLMEDVVQHIKCCDNLSTVVSILEPMVVWNRNNSNSCSREENQNLQQGKWQSSMYRYAADLMDFTCKNEVCESHRKWRLQVCLNNIKEGKYIQ